MTKKLAFALLLQSIVILSERISPDYFSFCAQKPVPALCTSALSRFVPKTYGATFRAAKKRVGRMCARARDSREIMLALDFELQVEALQTGA